LKAAVFVGGMEGVELEFELFRHHHPDAGVIALAAPGGAARTLALSPSNVVRDDSDNVDFAGLFRNRLLPILG
jgi:hypothetical protein